MYISAWRSTLKSLRHGCTDQNHPGEFRLIAWRPQPSCLAQAMKDGALCSAVFCSCCASVSLLLSWQAVLRCHFPRKGLTYNSADCLFLCCNMSWQPQQTEIRRGLLSLWAQLAEAVRGASPLFQGVCGLMSHTWAPEISIHKRIALVRLHIPRCPWCNIYK